MEAIIERTPKRVVVSMSVRRWNRIQQLEEAYKLARIIKRSMKQAETAPSMTVEEAMDFLDKPYALRSMKRVLPSSISMTRAI